MREKPGDVVEVNGFVLLQESDDVSLTSRLDKVLEVSALRVVYFKLRLDLAYSVD